jgi:peptidoglycan pentaglycine glycine transferase (the first glycine)
MNLKINYSVSKKKWDDFLKKRGQNFLQSFSWGEFKKNYQKVKRIQVEKDGKIVGVCQFFKEKNLFGSYFYIPFGPVADSQEVVSEIIKEVVKQAKKEKDIFFIKIESVNDIKQGVCSYHRIQPQKTLFLEIEDDPDDLLKKFRKSTRYNIKQAARKGVSIEKGGDVDYFFEMIEKTKERQGFETYPKEYFKKILENYKSDIILAKYEEKVIAANIVVYFGEMATYLHSAFDYRYRNFNAPALLRFKSIEIAKKKGCKKYDFWGLDEKKFPGVTKFKKGFGGKEFIYPPTRDIPLKKGRYFVYYLASIIKMHLK